MGRTLCVGDPHTEQGDDLNRFGWLGEYIVDEKPNTIILMGDFLSIDSLSAWDRNNRKTLEGKRFRKELDVGREAIELMMSPLIEYNTRMKLQKKATYKPKLIYLEGNHEERWWRYVNQHPEMDRMVDIYGQIGLRQHRWEIVPYRDYTRVEGVYFTHVPMNGINKPISGTRIIDTALKGHSDSVVFGHTHTLAYGCYARHGEDKLIQALNVGWFGDIIPDYATGSQLSKSWWSGLVMLQHTGWGSFDFTTISLGELKNEYTPEL